MWCGLVSLALAYWPQGEAETLPQYGGLSKFDPPDIWLGELSQSQTFRAVRLQVQMLGSRTVHAIAIYRSSRRRVATQRQPLIQGGRALPTLC
jgi:hypothetical protein